MQIYEIIPNPDFIVDSRIENNNNLYHDFEFLDNIYKNRNDSSRRVSLRFWWPSLLASDIINEPNYNSLIWTLI